MNKRKGSLMYLDSAGERLQTWNPHPGCEFNCTYCYGPAQYARFSKCADCKAFNPHFHEKRMKQKFEPGTVVFVESTGDPSFIPPDIFQQILYHLAKFPDTKFRIQSKNPMYFLDFEYSSNVWLGTTIETNIDKLAQCYSKAPVPSLRFRGLLEMTEKNPELNYYLTFEPIMVCSIFEMLDMAMYIGGGVEVFIGRENHEHHLPEPSEEDLGTLVELLQRKLGKERVHTKTLGPAWWEIRGNDIHNKI